jgi:DNA polymerase III sliding clamp (beta) subunit (PCNA family)
MAETPINPVENVEAVPTPAKPLTRFRATVSGGDNAVFTTDNLKSIIETVVAFSDAVTFLINADGIKVKVLDNARIALLDAALPRNVFISFDANGEGYVAVDAKSLLAVLRRAKNKEVELKFEDGVLVVTIAGVRSFRVRTLDSGKEEAPQPKTAHTAFAVIDAELFKEALIDAKVVKADAVRLVALNGALTCKAVNETKEVEVRLAPAEGEAASTYALDYLVKAAKAFGDGVVEVKFGNNTPLELTTTFSEGYVKVFIAPRVE